MAVTTAEIDSAIPTAGTPSRSLTNALLKTLVAEQQADMRVTVAGRYYPIMGTTWNTNSSPTADTIYFTPFVIQEETTIDRLVLRVLTGVASGEVQLAVYASSPTTGRPTGSPLAETGVVSATVATLVDAVVTPVTLPPGIYYFAIQFNSTTLRWTAVNSNVGTQIGQYCGTDTAAAMFASSGGMSVLVTASNVYGSWPTDPTIVVSGSTSIQSPLGAYRVAV